MRRTKQGANRHQGRGIRSRFVACVAAVAMLATSVAAGTAVAVELGDGNATDQTTQNTATLEQQGTGNTDDNNQTTTNGDGQADGDQDVTESGGTAEGNGNTTGTGGTGTTDGDETVAGDGQTPDTTAPKNVNEAPAPQSTEAGNGVSLLADEPEYTGDEIFSEDFLGKTVSDTRWLAFGDACLTAADTVMVQGEDGRQLAGCLKEQRHGGEDHTNGTSTLSGQVNGALQLTDMRLLLFSWVRGWVLAGGWVVLSI